MQVSRHVVSIRRSCKKRSSGDESGQWPACKRRQPKSHNLLGKQDRGPMLHPLFCPIPCTVGTFRRPKTRRGFRTSSHVVGAPSLSGRPWTGPPIRRAAKVSCKAGAIRGKPLRHTPYVSPSSGKRPMPQSYPKQRRLSCVFGGICYTEMVTRRPGWTGNRCADWQESASVMTRVLAARQVVRPCSSELQPISSSARVTTLPSNSTFPPTPKPRM